jgi:hypothetical protein
VLYRHRTRQSTIPLALRQMAIYMMDNTSVISWKFVVFGSLLLCTDKTHCRIFTFFSVCRLSKLVTTRNCDLRFHVDGVNSPSMFLIVKLRLTHSHRQKQRFTTRAGTNHPRRIWWIRGGRTMREVLASGHRQLNLADRMPSASQARRRCPARTTRTDDLQRNVYAQQRLRGCIEF